MMLYQWYYTIKATRQDPTSSDGDMKKAFDGFINRLKIEGATGIAYLWANFTDFRERINPIVKECDYNSAYPEDIILICYSIFNI